MSIRTTLNVLPEEGAAAGAVEMAVVAAAARAPHADLVVLEALGAAVVAAEAAVAETTAATGSLRSKAEVAAVGPRKPRLSQTTRALPHAEAVSTPTICLARSHAANGQWISRGGSTQNAKRNAIIINLSTRR